ncbi:FtsK/SpoIIIE domain-containing protein [Actinosynnema sp. NPDC053489]|uniref:FtsK/SpoIIIE domain-containing protein n=1 Tax=Actinosynnema sp. NPDC053489 TaxID=3363916 RepID=UPI0037C78833
MTTPHHDHDDEDGERTNVVHLPVRHVDATSTPDGVGTDGAMVGELLTDAESAELDRRMAAQNAARTAAGAVVAAVRHERTRSIGRAVRRNAGYAVAGARIRRQERRARRKHLDLEQAITTLRVNAKSAEDFHVLRELEEVLERRRSGAAQRGRERRIEILRWSGGVVLLLASGHVVFLGFSAVQTVIGAASLTDRWNGMVDFWATVADLSPMGGYWWAWAIAGAGTWAARTIPVGRDRGALPVWAAEVGQAVPADGRDIVVDESAVLSALRYLGGLPLLKQAFKQGWGSSITPTWLQLPHKDGDGVRMQLVLPRGVPVEEIVKRKTTFAHNLSRLPVEVWPSEPKDRAGVLDLWVADPGALSKPVGSWPLLESEGAADFFDAIPVGVNIRGEVVRAQLFEKNYAAAGVMGSGKSSLFITLVAGAILDPLVEVDVFVLAENADYDPMAPRLRTLRTGADRDTMKVCLETLRALYDELGPRGKALREHNVRRVNRKVAEKDARLRPRVVVIDECQALFMDEEYGETAADLVTKLISAARKYGIVLMFATPEASTASLPRKIMAVTSCKACFAIGDQQSNDAILGTGSYKAGISAVSLEPKTDESPGDVGTAMVRGIMAKPGLLRGFYLDPAELAEVTERATDLRDSHVPAPTSDDDQPEDVDFLADLARVLAGHKHLRTAEVLRALIDLRADHYRDYTSKTLAAALAEVGVPIVKRDRGQSAVDTNDVAEAITMRDMENGADTDDHAEDED